ncbi:hypothetical protein TraAM80_00706 [Trypanosoma rangeli]|uniref:Calponin-homology (CH) domain-containing protein n=1 Tax=Trypanosoma rangeli TaxID=5698 RepID=A0A422P2B7_TRYRA|nr:uncharacterized protein TraAM80_00706 [Trypanosoma rangeli]RNF11870.1 hypothetical protein TraAM80_00706 [Trypanosoma rangeli]|eukprot:RNF11870.1 hypothetical protein TraAM80_00706 [Trypanosoma rangeli]
MSTWRGDGVGERGVSYQKGLVAAASGCIFRPRQLTGEEGTDVIAQETRELLEGIRVDLSQLKGSVDLRENTERLMSLKAARQLIAYKCMLDTAEQQTENATASQQIPHAGFFFVPMAMAPMTRLTICDYQERVTQRQTSKLERIDAAPPQDPPPWNSSTSLQSSEKATGEKISGGSVSVQHRSLIPTARMVSAANTLHASSGEENCLKQSSSPKEHGTDGTPDEMLFVSRLDEMWIRDYLRRLNIVTRDSTELEERIDDPVLNGVALRHLVDVALKRERKDGGVMRPAIVLRPKNLDDVRLNYVSALNLLRAAEKNATFEIPKECRLIRPEGVIVRGDSAALFTLMRTVVDTYLPTNCEQLWSASPMTWQTYPDGGSYAASAMSSLELAVCAFLCSLNILADPVLHQLPPDDAVVPNALMAPFLPPQRKLWQVRTDGFSSLYIPSVFPFLTNGTALCDVVAEVTGNRLSVHRNPRVKSNCMENIQAAFTELQKYCPVKMSPFFLDAPECVFYGDRRYILLLLEDVMRMANGVVPRRRAPCSSDTPYLGGQPPSEVLHVPMTQASRPSFSTSLPEVRAHQCLAESAAWQSARVSGNEEGLRHPDDFTPRCVIASPLSGRRGAVCTSLTKRASPSSAPLGEANVTVSTLNAPVAIMSGVEYTEDEVELLRKWLIAVLGSDFHYTAADHSFSVSCRDLQLSGNSLIFSDGVVLAHVIRVLERRRCVELDSLEMHAKATASKRRNIRKCVSFLQTEKRTLLNVPLLDEILLSGNRLGVLYVVHCLKSAYRFAVRL